MRIVSAARLRGSVGARAVARNDGLKVRDPFIEHDLICSCLLRDGFSHAELVCLSLVADGLTQPLLVRRLELRDTLRQLLRFFVSQALELEVQCTFLLTESGGVALLGGVEPRVCFPALYLVELSPMLCLHLNHRFPDRLLMVLLPCSEPRFHLDHLRGVRLTQRDQRFLHLQRMLLAVLLARAVVGTLQPLEGECDLLDLLRVAIPRFNELTLAVRRYLLAHQLQLRVVRS